MNKLLFLLLALVPLLLVLSSFLIHTATAQTSAKSCINQELKNAIGYASILETTGHVNDINQTFYDIGTNVIMKCMVK